MTRAEIIALLARFPFWMRPFVWLQLMLIRRWQVRHQRGVLIEVNWRTGRLRIAYIGDAPPALDAYHYTAPRRTAWQRLAIALPAPECTYVRTSFVLFPGTGNIFVRAVAACPDTS
jgi:hypothetical protein